MAQLTYPGLEKVLNARALLDDEKKMWLRLGIYVTTEAVYNASVGYKCLILYDGMGNDSPLTECMGNNIRRQVINWWQVERIKPRASEPIDNTGLAELENRSV